MDKIQKRRVISVLPGLQCFENRKILPSYLGHVNKNIIIQTLSQVAKIHIWEQAPNIDFVSGIIQQY